MTRVLLHQIYIAYVIYRTGVKKHEVIEIAKELR